MYVCVCINPSHAPEPKTKKKKKNFLESQKKIYIYCIRDSNQGTCALSRTHYGALREVHACKNLINKNGFPGAIGCIGIIMPINCTCTLLCPFYLLQNSDDLSAVGDSIQMNAPYIVVCVSPEEVSFHIMVERDSLSEVSTFKSALIHLIASYFVYDIAYPKPWYSTLILVQHHIFGLTDKQRVPANVVEIATSLKRMDSVS